MQDADSAIFAGESVSPRNHRGFTRWGQLVDFLELPSRVKLPHKVAIRGKNPLDNNSGGDEYVPASPYATYLGIEFAGALAAGMLSVSQRSMVSFARPGFFLCFHVNSTAATLI